MSEISPYVEGFRVTIKAILNTSDLSTISAKGVRKQLVAAGADPDKVKEHRKEFDTVITEAFNHLPPPPAATSSAHPSPSRSPSGSAPPASSQPKPLSKPKPKPKVKADVKPRVTAASSGTPKKRKSVATIVDSDASGSEFGGSVSDSDVGTGKKKRKTGGGGGGGGAFNKEMALSPALARLVASGSPADDPNPTQCSRPQTVKRIWNHIKENGLQDPNDKRHIMCDDLMYAVFKTKRLHMFTMNKLLSSHLSPLEG